MFLWLLVFNQWRRLLPMHLGAGLLLFLAVAAPWHILAAQRNPRWAEFYFIHEHWTRFTTTTHGRQAPFWFFGPVILVDDDRLSIQIAAETPPVEGISFERGAEAVGVFEGFPQLVEMFHRFVVFLSHCTLFFEEPSTKYPHCSTLCSQTSRTAHDCGLTRLSLLAAQTSLSPLPRKVAPCVLFFQISLGINFSAAVYHANVSTQQCQFHPAPAGVQARLLYRGLSQ